MSWVCQFCGSDDESQCFPIWREQSESFGLCFQQVAVEMTTSILFAVFSAYNGGRQHTQGKRYRRLRSPRVLTARLLLSILMTLTYVIEGLVSIWVAARHPPVFWSVAAVGAVTWTTHSFYIWAAGRNIFFCNRQIGLLLVWSLTFISSCLQFYTAVGEESWPGGHSSHQWIEDYGYSHALSVVIRFGLQIFCLPIALVKVKDPLSSGIRQLLDSMANKEENLSIQSERERERQPLLGKYGSGRYPQTDTDRQVRPLVAEEGANFLSWLFFWWVGDLMVQGSNGQLEKPEQLMLLPTSLRTERVRGIFRDVFGKVQAEDVSSEEADANANQDPVRMRENWSESFEKSTGRESPSLSIDSLNGPNQENIADKPHSRKRTLWIALNKTFGCQYYPLGVLKLIADLLGFAGPLLLHELVSFMESRSTHTISGYYYAAGLSVATLLAALISSQFTYLVNAVGLDTVAVVKFLLAAGQSCECSSSCCSYHCCLWQGCGCQHCIYARVQYWTSRRFRVLCLGCCVDFLF